LILLDRGERVAVPLEGLEIALSNGVHGVQKPSKNEYFVSVTGVNARLQPLPHPVLPLSK
jgi:hypothetical protein